MVCNADYLTNGEKTTPFEDSLVLVQPPGSDASGPIRLAELHRIPLIMPSSRPSSRGTATS